MNISTAEEGETLRMTEMPHSKTDDEDSAASTGGNGDGDDHSTNGKHTYIAIDGISPGDMDEIDKERLLVAVQNELLAELQYPIEDTRIVSDPNYVVEFTNE